MLKYLPIGFRTPDCMRSINYMNLGYGNLEAKANEKFLKLVDDTKYDIPEKYNHHSRKYKKEVESSNLYKLLIKMPKSSFHLEELNGHIYSRPWTRRPNDNKIISHEDFKEMGTFPNLHNHKLNPFKEMQIRQNLIQKNMCNAHQDKEMYTQWPPSDYQRVTKILENDHSLSWKTGLYNSCLNALNEGAMSVQAKVYIGEHYNDKGEPLNLEEEIEAYIDCARKVHLIEKNFNFSLRIQISSDCSDKDLEKYDNMINEAQQTCGDIMLGIDIVDDIHHHQNNIRDKSSSSSSMTTTMSSTSGHIQPNENVRLVLHEGQRSKEINDNVIDYFVMRCPNIGHNVNLVKYSDIFQEMKAPNVKIEASIQSNPLKSRTMRFVPEDFHNQHHPLTKFLDPNSNSVKQNHMIPNTKADNGEDDNAIEDISQVEMRFIAWDLFTSAMSLDFDLYDFKRVFTKGIENSDLSEENKENFKKAWEIRWNKYIKEILEDDQLCE